MEELFRNHCKTIRIYFGVEKETDPFEHTVETTMLNPLPIKAIISDVAFAKIQWAMPGIVADKAKEIIIEKKHENLLKQSQKISINGEFYQGWRQNGKLQYRQEGLYIRAYIYFKKS